jgi:hypothetical protein
MRQLARCALRPTATARHLSEVGADLAYCVALHSQVIRAAASGRSQPRDGKESRGWAAVGRGCGLPQAFVDRSLWPPAGVAEQVRRDLEF